MSSTISRVLSRMVIYLGCMSPCSSGSRFRSCRAANPKARRATVSLSVRPCFGWGLHLPLPLPEGRWSLKPPFHPYRNKYAPAVYFCCTSLGVASTGRYPAPCPVKPGLSSPYIGATICATHIGYTVLKQL
jgi:hypothetical protein